MNTLNIVESIFSAALEKTTEARAAYLDEACKGDPTLRRAVERFLVAHGKADDILAVHAPGLPETIAPPIEERPGAVIGPFKLLQQLGEGGFGVVFMAEQELPVRRKVALKIIKPGMDSKQVVARFEAERQALALMDHPNIARVFDGGTTESGRPYFVMELVKGTPITEFCDKNRLTPRERLELFIPVCQAVQHAHQKGIIHRDLKPSNVLVTMYDDKPVPKVIDFGVAKAIEQKLTEQTLFTRVGQIIGTLEYMSPEQASLNALDVDTRADVYALGVLLYELLTGSTPLNKNRAQNVAFLEMLRLIREEEPPRPSTRLSESGDALIACAVDRKTDSQKLPKLVKGELDWITMKALEKDRARRYETASAMAADVQRYLRDEQVEACPPSFAYRLRKYARKHKTAFAMTSMAAGLLLFGIAATTWQAVRATLAEADATTQRNAVVVAERQVRAERDVARGANVHLEATQEDLRSTLYYARSTLLQLAWDANNMEQVFQLQNQQRPGPNERDLRDFEWHYRDRLCHLDTLTISGLGGNRPPPITPAFSPDGKYVVALAKAVGDEKFPGFSRDQIAIYDLAEGRERTRLQIGADHHPESFLWSADSKFVLTCHQDGGPFGVPPGMKAVSFSTDFVLYDAADGHEIYRLFQSEKVKESGGTPGSRRAGPVIEDVVFSPEGKYLAITSNVFGSRGIVVHDAATGKVIRRLATPPDRRSSQIVFSADGSRMAAAVDAAPGNGPNPKSRITVWDVTNGEELFSVEPRVTAFETIRFSPDGTQVAAICTEYTGKVSTAYTSWDIASGKELKALPILQKMEFDFDRPGMGGFSTHLFSPDGTRLALCQNSPAGSASVLLYDTATGQLVDTLRDAASVTAIAFSPEGKMLAAASRDSVIRVWDLGLQRTANGTPALMLRGHTNDVRRLDFHPDGSRLFSAGMDGMVKVWDVARRDRPVTVSGTKNRLNDEGPFGSRFSVPFVFSETSGRIMVASSEKYGGGPSKPDEGKPTTDTMTVWDLAGKSLGSFAIPTSDTGNKKLSRDQPMALSPDSTRLAMISFLGDNYAKGDAAELHLIEVDTGKTIFMNRVDRMAARGASLAFSRDGTQIAWGIANLTSLEVQSPSGVGVFRTSADSQLRLLDATDGTEVRRIKIDDGDIDGVTFTPDGTRVVTSTQGPRAKVTVWNVGTGERLVEMSGLDSAMRVERLVISNDGKRLAGIVGARGFRGRSEVVVWDSATGKSLFTLADHTGPFANVAFTPNGRRIATATSSGSHLGFSPPGTRSGSEVKLWDAATGNELMTLKDLNRNFASCFTFSSDGTRLYAVGPVERGPRDKIEIRTWDATPQE